MATDQRRFLAVMGENTGDRDLASRLAKALLAVQAVNLASPRTECARFEQLV
jgi:hypothetical protein